MAMLFQRSEILQLFQRGEIVAQIWVLSIISAKISGKLDKSSAGRIHALLQLHKAALVKPCPLSYLAP